jgi:DNA primase
MDFVEQLKSSIDIVKVVGDYVRLRRVGSTGRYLGLCPFHQEKTPSFNVNQTRQFYKCFGCGVGGDALKFVMEVEGLTFPEALKLLAERNGIPMPKRTEYSDAASKLSGALFEMHAIAAEMYHASLKGPQGGEARAYLQRRELSSEMIETFDLGFSDPGGQLLTRRFMDEGFTGDQLEASGLVRRRTEGGYYDAFRGRLMFPIHNESGKVIAFGGRSMREGDEPKYLNSPETPIYKKTSVLYNLHRARDGMRKMNRAVLVEGYMDVIGVYAAGIKEVVASCGTALTNPQVRALHRHADTVIVNFDPDTAGANAAEKAIQLFLDEGMHVKVLSFGGGESGLKLDPDEFVKQFGADEYRNRLDSASTYFHWLADRARARFDMRSSDGRMDAFKFLLPAVQKITDKLERAAVANDLAGYLGVDPGLVLDQFKRSATDRRTVVPTQKPRLEMPALERILLNSLISSEETRRQILPRLPHALEETFETHEIFSALAHVTEQGSASPFADMDARLSEGSKALLHELTTADEIGDDAMCLAQAEACLCRLEDAFHKRQLDRLRAQVKAAEREGKVEQALKLLGELGRLEQEARDAATL